MLGFSCCCSEWGLELPGCARLQSDGHADDGSMQQTIDPTQATIAFLVEDDEVRGSGIPSEVGSVCSRCLTLAFSVFMLNVMRGEGH
jgi:hypothetical protein